MPSTNYCRRLLKSWWVSWCLWPECSWKSKAERRWLWVCSSRLPSALWTWSVCSSKSLSKRCGEGNNYNRNISPHTPVCEARQSGSHRLTEWKLSPKWKGLPTRSIYWVRQGLLPPRLAANSSTSCLHIPNAGKPGVHTGCPCHCLLSLTRTVCWRTQQMSVSCKCCVFHGSLI